MHPLLYSVINLFHLLQLMTRWGYIMPGRVSLEVSRLVSFSDAADQVFDEFDFSWQGLCRLSLSWGLPDVFLTVQLGLWVWGGRLQRYGAVFITSCQGYTCKWSTWFLAADAELALEEVGLIGLLHCQVTSAPYLPRCRLCEEVPACSPHLGSGGYALLFSGLRIGIDYLQFSAGYLFSFVY